jgi:hypothetical protein
MCLLFFLTACGGLLPTPSPSQLDTQTSPGLIAIGTPTPTIDWFPATDTPTFFPTQTPRPTLDQSPGLGDLLFADSFDRPGLWSISESASASAILTRNKLLLSISGEGPLSITSMRSQPSLSDFYAEVKVQLGLCESTDQFGMIFRAAPGNNDYRIVVGCDGQVRLEHNLSGSHLPLNKWLSSGDAPIAAPAEVKLGVWAAGSEMRLFLNDHYQFSVVDRSLQAGTIGFFAFAGGAAPITASFSDLVVYSVAYISPTPSLTPSRTPTLTRTPIPSPTPTP